MALKVGFAAALAGLVGQREGPADEGASAAAGLAADYRAGLRLLHVIPGDEATAGQHEAEHDDEQDAAEGRHGANLEQIRVGWNRLQRSIDPVNLLYPRSEEHTSELQSLMRISYAVFCLKKKTNKDYHKHKSDDC